MAKFHFFLVAVATTFLTTVFVSATDLKQQKHHHDEEGDIQFRLCIPSQYISLCRKMIASRHSEHRLQCISAPDKIACIDRILKGDADFTILDPEELYVAHRFLPTNGLVVTSEIRSHEYASRDHRYAPVAVVRKSAQIKEFKDLRGKRSCHTGFARNAGWRVPFSVLFTQRELRCTNASLNAVERDLATVEEYFGPACVPGKWVQDPVTDKALKSKYSKLCTLCDNSELCSMDDTHAGYDGTLRCLTNTGNNAGDVAWTKYDAVRDFFKLNETSPSELAEEYEFLCRDKTTVPLTSENPCTWAQRPWRTVVMTAHLAGNVERVKELQQQVTLLRQEAQQSPEAPEWLAKVLDFYRNTDVEFHHDPYKVKTLTPKSYLKTTRYSETFWHPSCGILEKSLRICVYNQVELEKCQGLKLAAIGQRISPGFSCILGTCAGHCSKLVAKGDTDLLVVGGGHAYKVETSEYLKPKLVSILRNVEMTGEANVTVPFRYALAVIRSEIQGEFQGSLSALRGKRSCHGSIKSVEGWNAPLAVLRDAQEISGENCDLSVELSKYFSKSCVPGVPEASQTNSKLPTQLCSLCAGDGTEPGKAFTPETVCANDATERYQGSSGALRCLTDEVADVAFIDHVTLLQKRNSISHGTKEAFDVKLLCSNGTVAGLDDFKSCNWGVVPSQKVLSRGGDENKILRENAVLSLLRAQELFRPGSKDERIFKLFGSYYGTKDVIFQDGSVGLQAELSEEERERENKIVKDFKCEEKSHYHPHGNARSLDLWAPNEQI